MENLKKDYFYLKENVFSREYRMYKYLDNLNFTFIPKLYDYDKEKKILKTQRINGMSVSDLYGEKFANVPKNIIKKIRNIIRTLHKIGIIYPDITGYNFIEKNKKIYIIDFGDAQYKKKDKELNWFLSYFLAGHNGWNPDFR